MGAEFGYCKDCRELCYALPTNNGVFTQSNKALNHHNCDNYVNFDKKPVEYPPPICNVLTKLKSGAEISHNEIILFKLAMDLHDML